jgi:RNA polymerase sigma factor (sigma-70 family)
MQELDDAILLRQYVECDSEEAFAALVTRHINKVYSVAMRHTRSAHQAEEITQAVFVMLARKASKLGKKVVLSGWLYQTARLMSVTFLRSEIRRASREQEAQMQTVLDQSEADAWTQIAPLLDTAIATLNETDRCAIVLRFFDGRSMSEVGAALGATEATAKKRVSRAPEKLRGFFRKRGVVLPVTVVMGAISANCVEAAPPLLAESITAVVLTKGVAASGSTAILVKGAIRIMAWTKAKTALVSVVVCAGLVTTVTQHRAQEKLRAENEVLQSEIAQLRSERASIAQRSSPVRGTLHLPAPRVQVAAPASESATDGLPTAPLYTRLWKDGKDIKLTADQVQAYLSANGRTAATLVAAFRATDDPKLLREALQNYPNDPRVNFAAAVNKDFSPEERRQWLDALKQSAPNNALANYLSARAYFSSGQNDQAVGELIAASGKPELKDYSLEFVQNAEEAFLAAGYSVAEAKTISTTGLPLPQLGAIRELGADMVNLANSYRQAGDEASAQATLQMAANLGQGYRAASAEQMVSQFVGFTVEKQALQAMDPTSPYGDNGQTVQGRIDQITQQRAELGELTQQVSPILERMPDQDWISFNDRLVMFGEEAAMRWLAGKYVR